MRFASRRAREFAVLIIALVALAGCTEEAKPAPAAGEPKAGATAGSGTESLRIAGHDPSEFPQPGEPAVTIVIKPGSDPQPVRYQFEMGATQEFVVEQTQSIAGQQQSAPALAIPGRGSVVKSDHNVSTLQYEFQLSTEQLSLPPARLSVVTDSLARSLSVRKLRIDVDPKLAGVVDSIVEQLVGAVTLFPIPLPDSPIGVGAQWEALQTIDFRGITVHRALRVEVTGKSEGALEVTSVSVIASPRAQRLELPSGQIVEVLRASAQGNGEFVINLSNLLPIGSRNVEHVQTTRIAPPPGPGGTGPGGTGPAGTAPIEPRTVEITESYRIRQP